MEAEAVELEAEHVEAEVAMARAWRALRRLLAAAVYDDAAVVDGQRGLGHVRAQHNLDGNQSHSMYSVATVCTTLVHRATFRWPRGGGAKTLDCSAAGSSPWSGRRCQRAAPGILARSCSSKWKVASRKWQVASSK